MKTAYRSMVAVSALVIFTASTSTVQAQERRLGSRLDFWTNTGMAATARQARRIKLGLLLKTALNPAHGAGVA